MTVGQRLQVQIHTSIIMKSKILLILKSGRYVFSGCATQKKFSILQKILYFMMQFQVVSLALSECVTQQYLPSVNTWTECQFCTYVLCVYVCTCPLVDTNKYIYTIRWNNTSSAGQTVVTDFIYGASSIRAIIERHNKSKMLPKQQTSMGVGQMRSHCRVRKFTIIFFF